eukprot:TRINITY_DN7975_c0_g2_i2.p1 TRINITY_DN7975_c0_g2~~TRINITY_DN7975_c0_g2_i2.p1  ORF type:complete len:348 (+),score=76.38 TRINITY_DN7975_c0_g2_i2:94-1044(+)
MGRKAGTSIAEQKKALALRQSALNNQEAKRNLSQILKTNPHLWKELYEHAKSMGYDVDTASVNLVEHAKLQPKKPKQQLAIADGSLAQSHSPAAKAAAAASSSRAEEDVTIANQSIEFILARLHASEPVLCAPKALTAMIPAGKRQYNKPDLLRLYEFVTGRNPGATVAIELEDVDAFDGELAEDADRRGHRLSDVPLPPDYNSHGIYKYDKRQFSLRHRFTSEEVELDETTRADMQYPEKAVIYSNWSETTAYLKVPGTRFTCVLSSLFSNQFPGRQSPTKEAKRPRLQLEGDVKSPPPSKVTDAAFVPPPPKKK